MDYTLCTVVKFSLKVGSQGTTKIQNLVLVVLLVTLILLPYHMLFVISCQTDIHTEIGKTENDTLKKLYI